MAGPSPLAGLPKCATLSEMLRTSATILLAAWICLAAESGPPTIDQSLTMKSVAGAKISPDGRYVAWLVQQTDWDENDFVSQIWVAPVSGGKAYQLTRGKKSSADPQWSPDSSTIAFLSNRDGKRQIYLISPTGGEAAQLTAEDNDVSDIAWSPDGSSIAFTSVGPDAKAKKDRKEKYGDFSIINGDYDMSHLWMVKVPAEIPAIRSHCRNRKH